MLSQVRHPARGCALLQMSCAGAPPAIHLRHAALMLSVLRWRAPAALDAFGAFCRRDGPCIPCLGLCHFEGIS